MCSHELNSNLPISRTGRMEAKGCAKSAEWKASRRFFYWAVRARVARSTALKTLAEASPNSTHEYRSFLLKKLNRVESFTTYQEEAIALEKLDLTATVAQLKAEYLSRCMVELTKDDRKAALDGFLLFANGLSEDDRTAVINALQNAPRSPGSS